MNINTPTTTSGDETKVRAVDLILMSDANDKGLIPRRRGRKRSRTDLWNMHTKGRKNAAGELIKLRVVREGKTIFTSAAWIDAYFGALAAPAAPPSPRERRRRSHANTRSTPQMSADAAATLRKHGLAAAAGLEAPAGDGGAL